MTLEEAVTKPLQGKNKVGEHIGSLSELAKIHEINLSSLLARMKRGMSLEEALTKPVNKYNKNK